MEYKSLKSRDKLLEFATQELETGKQYDFFMLLIQFEDELTEKIKNDYTRKK